MTTRPASTDTATGPPSTDEVPRPHVAPSLVWSDGAIRVIDQRALPHETRWVRLETVDEVIEAIRSLAVRGAPAIGLAGALGVALSARTHGGGRHHQHGSGSRRRRKDRDRPADRGESGVGGRAGGRTVAARAGRPGGRVCYRNFLAKHQVPEEARSALFRDEALSTSLTHDDRAFVYDIEVLTVKG